MQLRPAVRRTSFVAPTTRRVERETSRAKPRASRICRNLITSASAPAPPTRVPTASSDATSGPSTLVHVDNETSSATND